MSRDFGSYGSNYVYAAVNLSLIGIICCLLCVVFDPLCYVSRAFVMPIYLEKELYKAPVMHRCECMYVRVVNGFLSGYFLFLIIYYI